MLNHPKRLAFFLPNIFTALNLACGFNSIILSFRHEYYYASMILFLGAIFDSVDGRVARMTGTQSQFGEEFDSLSDLISFGMAPALLIYHQSLSHLGRLGIVVAFLYLLCTALRLARFNVNTQKVSSAYFQGLPSPMAALGIIGYVLLSLEFSFLNDVYIFSAAYLLFYSVLMISNIPFFSFKDAEWVRNHKKRVLVVIFLLFALIFTYEHLMVGVIVSTYVVGSLIYFLTHQGALKDVFLWKGDEDEEDEAEDE